MRRSARSTSTPTRVGTWQTHPKRRVSSTATVVQWVDESTGQTVGDEPLYTIGPPNIFNMDSMGYNADVIHEGAQRSLLGRALQREYKGRVALLNDPGIGLQDAALEQGRRHDDRSDRRQHDQGRDRRHRVDPPRPEVEGPVPGVLDQFDESVNLMASNEVVLESMWSPAVALLVAQGLNVRYAAIDHPVRRTAGSQRYVARDANRPRCDFRAAAARHAGADHADRYRREWQHLIATANRDSRRLLPGHQREYARAQGGGDFRLPDQRER